MNALQTSEVPPCHCDSSARVPFDSASRRARRLPYHAVRFFPAALLLGAGLLKSFDPDPHLMGTLGSRVLTLIEVLAAILVIGNWRPALARKALIALFSIFLGVSLWQSAHSSADCGCFGSISVPPAYMVAVDLSIVLLIISSRLPSANWSRRGDVATAAAMLALTLLGMGALPDLATRLARTGVAGKLTILTPENWLNVRLPILADIQPPLNINAGQHGVMLILHPDCAACRRALSHLGHSKLKPEMQHRAMIVEIPGVDGHSLAAQTSTEWEWHRLRPDRRWFATTPILLDLVDWNVRRVVSGEAVVAELRQWTESQ